MERIKAIKKIKNNYRKMDKEDSAKKFAENAWYSFMNPSLVRNLNRYQQTIRFKGYQLSFEKELKKLESQLDFLTIERFSRKIKALVEKYTDKILFYM